MYTNRDRRGFWRNVNGFLIYTLLFAVLATVTKTTTAGLRPTNDNDKNNGVSKNETIKNITSQFTTATESSAFLPFSALPSSPFSSSSSSPSSSSISNASQTSANNVTNNKTESIRYSISTPSQTNSYQLSLNDSRTSVVNVQKSNLTFEEHHSEIENSVSNSSFFMDSFQNETKQQKQQKNNILFLNSTSQQRFSDGKISSTNRQQSQQQQTSNLPTIEKCEYGQIRQYHFSFTVNGPMGENVSTTGILSIKCLHQLNFDSLNDLLNGQKFVAQITSIESRIQEDSTNDQNDGVLSEYNDNNQFENWSGNSKNNNKKRGRSKRSGFYQYFEHLWTDIKTILPFEETRQHGMSKHDSFDDEMLKTLKLDLHKKCSWNDITADQLSLLPELGDKDEEFGNEGSNNRGEKLPFWFVQLDDGSIPQIGFTKHERFQKVKNFKKFLTFLFAPSSTTTKEQKNISTNDSNLFSYLNNKEKTNEFTKIINNTQTQQFVDKRLVRLDGRLTFNALGVTNTPPPALNDVYTFAGVTLFYTLEENSVKQQENIKQKSKKNNKKLEQLFRQIEENYQESTREKTGNVYRSDISILENKHIRELSRLRRQLSDQNDNNNSRNNVADLSRESQYYTLLFEKATKSGEEYAQLARLVALEQQLNITNARYERSLSLIADLRRIGTLHNIQKVCQTAGPGRMNIQRPECLSFISLLLEAGSKTAQHALLFTVQNHDSRPYSEEEIISGLRLLSRTHRPTRWLIESLGHELHRMQQGERSPEHEMLFVQTLTTLAKRDSLTKLKQLITNHILRMILTNNDNSTVTIANNRTALSALQTIQIIEMLGNLGNYTALEQIIQNKQFTNVTNTKIPILIALLHANRFALERSSVRNWMAKLFQSGPCQIKQELIQILIDQIDSEHWSSDDPPTMASDGLEDSQKMDKRWPKYGFNEIDSLLENELSNPNENCAHHLIVAYLERKSNMDSARILSKYQRSQTFNATSFDFCLAESDGNICNFVQTLGTDVAGAVTMKSISNFHSSQMIFTKHSFSVHILSHRHSIGHLVITETIPASEIKLLWQSCTGESVPLGVYSVKSLVTNNSRNNKNNNTKVENSGSNSINSDSDDRERRLLATHSQIFPVKIVDRSSATYLDSSLTVQLNVNLNIEIVHERRSQWNTFNKQSDYSLVSTVLVGIVSELDNSDLIERRSIELQSAFQYESKQPIQSLDTSSPQPFSSSVDVNSPVTTRPTSVNFPNNGSPQMPLFDGTESGDAELILGTELFHSQIELNHRRSFLRKIPFGLGCAYWPLVDDTEEGNNVLNEVSLSDPDEESPSAPSIISDNGDIVRSKNSASEQPKSEQRQQLSNWSSSLRQVNLFTLPWHKLSVH